jgi:rSAM/selenodomain-associated transferase 2
LNISVIIPTYNESENIEKLVKFLLYHNDRSVKEIIVSDGGSTDDTLNLAAKSGAKAVTSPQRGRAAQMNYGASLATGDILYFIHADVLPPESFVKDIDKAISDGYDVGRYIMKFNTKKWWLCFNEFFTRFDLFVCYGGDQTLFIKKSLFKSCGGFRSDMLIMEDFEFTRRVRQQKGKYKIIQKGALISDRKYDKNSWWQVQKANYTIVKMYRQGASQQAMVNKYKEMLNYR